ncbi:MAG: hypothetical protein JW806_06420 [Sedimentisphaerales bacterium]|nr:hypothetical protein [Sedimentisphaerales bacterium]
MKERRFGKIKFMKSNMLIVSLSLVILTNSTSAITFYWDANAVGDWDDEDGMHWVDELGQSVTKPDGMYEVKIKHAGSIVTLDTAEGNWNYTGNGTRLRVYQGATMNIVDGADLKGFGWIRIGEQTGTPGQVGFLNQSGGRVLLRNMKEGGKLGIGDGYGIAPGSTYTMTGGILTYDVNDHACDGQLILGSRDGNGKFVVVGDDPVIHMKNLYIAGDNSGGTPYNYGTGTLEFIIGETGVSHIELNGTAYIDQGTDTIANLIVTLMATPQIGEDILLIDAANTIVGTFDSINDSSAEEGASVVLNYGDAQYLYAMTYTGGDDNKDVVLRWIPEPAAFILFALGGLLSIKKGKKPEYIAKVCENNSIRNTER